MISDYRFQILPLLPAETKPQPTNKIIKHIWIYRGVRNVEHTVNLAKKKTGLVGGLQVIVLNGRNERIDGTGI